MILKENTEVDSTVPRSEREILTQHWSYDFPRGPIRAAALLDIFQFSANCVYSA